MLRNNLRLHADDGKLLGEYAFTEFTPNVEVPASAFELRKL
jgi:hypothetical protein